MKDEKYYMEWARGILVNWDEDGRHPPVPEWNRVDATKATLRFLRESIPYGYGCYEKHVGATATAVLIRGLGISATEASELVAVASVASPHIFRDFLTGAIQPMVRVEGMHDA